MRCLTKKDLIYRNNAADIKAIIAVGEETIVNSINESMQESPSVEIQFYFRNTGNPKMVMLDHAYPLAHIVTAKYWHNLHVDSLHLTIADTGWLKAVWGKLYGQSETTLTFFTSP